MGSTLPPKTEKAKAGKDDKMRSIDELLREDAEGLLKELDDPEELRRWFNRVVEQLEREGLDGPPPPDKAADSAAGSARQSACAETR